MILIFLIAFFSFPMASIPVYPVPPRNMTGPLPPEKQEETKSTPLSGDHDKTDLSVHDEHAHHK